MKNLLLTGLILSLFACSESKLESLPNFEIGQNLNPELEAMRFYVYANDLEIYGIKGKEFVKEKDFETVNSIFQTQLKEFEKNPSTSKEEKVRRHCFMHDVSSFILREYLDFKNPDHFNDIKEFSMIYHKSGLGNVQLNHSIYNFFLANKMLGKKTLRELVFLNLKRSEAELETVKSAISKLEKEIAKQRDNPALANVYKELLREEMKFVKEAEKELTYFLSQNPEQVDLSAHFFERELFAAELEDFPINLAFVLD